MKHEHFICGICGEKTDIDGPSRSITRSSRSPVNGNWRTVRLRICELCWEAEQARKHPPVPERPIPFRFGRTRQVGEPLLPVLCTHGLGRMDNRGEPHA